MELTLEWTSSAYASIPAINKCRPRIYALEQCLKPRPTLLVRQCSTSVEYSAKVKRKKRDKSYSSSTTVFQDALDEKRRLTKELAVTTLKDHLNIPADLAQLLVDSPKSDEWLPYLEANPHFLVERIQYLVNCGVSRPEIVEHLPILMTVHFRSAIPSAIFDQREMLHPFCSHAEFIADLLDTSLARFYQQAIKTPDILNAQRVNNVSKAKLLIDFGYPKDLLLQRWQMLSSVSLPKLKRRIKMIQKMEDVEDIVFSRHVLFGSAHLLQDDGQYLAFLLKMTGQWQLEKLPPNILNRVNIFAELLGVRQADIAAAANDCTSVGNALFKTDKRLYQIIKIFAGVHVSGELLLHNRCLK